MIRCRGVSAVNFDSVETVSLNLPVERMRGLSDERMRQICAALAVEVACD